MRVTVLGAGYMGSAMATVARMRGHAVRLWGTWLDDALVGAVERGDEHPRLKLVLDPQITAVRAPDLVSALDGAELVVFAVSSDGVHEVISRAAPHLPDVPILSVTKGFLPMPNGTMARIDVAASSAAGRRLRFVHAAGPAKAFEVARGVLTLMQFAGSIEDATACVDALAGGHLVVTASADLAGAEICSALKNAYATGLGLWDGLVGRDCHNARAACFTQAIVEMAKLVTAGGGRPESVWGAAGVGDLHVTAAAGRNRLFGERVGAGTPAREVAERMRQSGELTEGYPAIASARRWAREHGVADIPLLDALHSIIWEGADVRGTLEALRLTA